MKITDRWYSERLEQEVGIARWGHFGTPVLIFPTAGGDAEEIERFLVIDCLRELIDQGKLKVYSCDSVAGRAWIRGEGSDRHRAWVQNQFHQFVLNELVPGIRNDCKSPDIPIIAAGASIGAFNAMAVACRFPSVFTRALCLSGTYDLTRFLANGSMPEDFYFSSPIHFLPGLEGAGLDAARKTFVLFASGQGRAEDIGQSWNAAGVLGGRGIPNRVDAWGAEWHHDWPTWRRMLPQYLGELIERTGA